MMLDGKSWDKKKVMNYICDELATSTKSLKRILRDGYKGYKLPSHVQIFSWLKDEENKEILNQYELAREFQGDTSFDEVMEAHEMAKIPILDDAGKPIKDKDGNIIYGMSGPSVAYAKLYSDNRKFAAVKLRPKKYGDKVDVNHGGQKDNPIQSLIREVSGNALPIAHRPTEGTINED